MKRSHAIQSRGVCDPMCLASVFLVPSLTESHCWNVYEENSFPVKSGLEQRDRNLVDPEVKHVLNNLVNNLVKNIVKHLANNM